MQSTFLDRARETGSRRSSPGGGWLAALFGGSSWLTAVGLLMVADLGISVLGLIVDPAVITGAPAWMKPLKFAVSTALFCFTVAWMIGQLKRTRRFAGWMGRALAVALTLEIVLIDLQAGRHTTSHFNFTTRLDSMIFGAMGLGIAVVLLATVALLVASCVERYEDRALGWAIRLGLVLALAGMGVGPLMTMPTPEQLAAQRVTGGRMAHIGAHTVGGPDGGAAMPVTGWSADHGDLRIAHFIGLHGMQVLLLGWWLALGLRGGGRRGVSDLGVVIAAAFSCALAFVVTLTQALRGQPLLRPEGGIAELWIAWGLLNLAGGVWLLVARGGAKAGLMKENAG
jgi:hypothetical protein